MYYPDYIFSINEDQTRRNMREYERRRKAWYDKAIELFPDYYNRNLIERVRILAPQIDAACGFSL